jgi:hypothetical protein
MDDHLTANGHKFQLALYRRAESELRAQYEKGEKRALWEMLSHCFAYRWPLPEWATEALTEANSLFESGRLKSWEQVFGKPFRGKTQNGSFTSAQAWRVWKEVNRRLQQEEEQRLDDGLFEDVAKDLCIGGKTTIKNLYYEYSRAIRNSVWTVGAKTRARTTRAKIR